MDQERLKKDLLALKSVKPILINLALDLLEEKKVLDLLKTPKGLNEICEEAQIKHEKMLENMLDLLTGENFLEYSSGKYKLLKKDKLPQLEEEQYLKENYSESLEWVYFVNNYSSQTLSTGVPSKLTGFEEEKAIYYWNKIMEQSPYSLREIAIESLLENLDENSLILDYGCGGGVSLQQLIDKTTKRLYFYATDPSTKYFSSARERLKNSESKTKTIEENKNLTQFIDFNEIKSYLGKFDRIFASMVFNHVEEKDYKQVFTTLNELLKKGGKFGMIQFFDFSKFDRNPIWIMHNIPTHKGYPMKEKFISDLKSVFPTVNEQLNGIITISTK